MVFALISVTQSSFALVLIFPLRNNISILAAILFPDEEWIPSESNIGSQKLPFTKEKRVVKWEKKIIHAA